jgi:hypothetical protein
MPTDHTALSGSNVVDSHRRVWLFPSQERKLVFLLCLLAFTRVFIFSAAIPFFNNVDEESHFDLIVKYSRGHVPRSLELASPEATPYVATFGTREFLWPSSIFPIAQFPPPWTQPKEEIGPTLLAREASLNKALNGESAQTPLYYTLAGLWWRLGRVCGFHDGFLLYWLRFLNGFLIVALVWLGFATARMIFPDRPFLKLGVPALLAFLPQSAFYSLQNDVLSPVCFGAAFLCLVRLMRTAVPGVRLGTATGIALAATYLTKISNLPLLAVSGGVVLCKVWRLAREGKLHAAGPGLTALVLCTGLPIAGWLAWTAYNFGDFTGTAAKIQVLGWTRKSFRGWWHHPIFTLRGLSTFVSGLLATFWRGELVWHNQRLASPVTDVFYIFSSLGFVAAALVNLHLKSTVLSASQRQALCLSLASFLAPLAFLGFLSTVFDFHDCLYPSTAHPYFTSGRLMLGALIPFLLLYLYGLDRVLDLTKGKWIRPMVLTGMILFMLLSEIAIDQKLFSNPYNWYHMHRQAGRNGRDPAEIWSERGILPRP